MIQEMQGMLPSGTVEKAVTALTTAGTVLGFVLWLAGSRFSRTMLTLMLFSLGSTLGMYVPMLMGWKIEGWATSMGAAMILGSSGFFLHRFWVAIGLGLVLAGWGAVVTWSIYNNGPPWHAPAVPTISMDGLQGISSIPELARRLPVDQYCRDLWFTIPGEVQSRLPYMCGGAMVWGIVVGLIWGRLGVVLLYSIAGVSLLAAVWVHARNSGAGWANNLPNQRSAETLVLLGMIFFGALVQLRFLPGRPKVVGPVGPRDILVA